jgi:hypothetical protein
MKKILVLLTIFTMVFTSCEPLEDINAEIDALDNPIVGDVIFTMSDDDYEVVDKSFGNFSSNDEAKEMIPTLLQSKYPVWGNKSSATVTFKIYSKRNDEKSLETYEVSDQDYEDGGHNYGNFSRASHIIDFLNTKFTSPANRLLVSLTYKYYAGSVSTLNNGFLFNNGAWESVQGFTDEEYNAMGESYPNFSNDDEAFAKIPLFLLDKFKFDGKKAGDIESAMYKVYVGGGVTESYVAYFVFDGSSWSKYSNTVEDTIQFGHDGATWVPDNTIKYTLVRNADYEYMASQLTDAEYAGLIGNLSTYGDFDYNWTDAQINFALALFLDYLDPSAAEGQKYILTYVIYDNGENDYQTSFIKTDGVWVVND